MVTFKGIMHLLQSLFSQTMKVRAPSNQKILGAIEGPELPLLGMVISFYFLIIFYQTIYWDHLNFFILAIHWDFVLEFFFFAFLGYFIGTSLFELVIGTSLFELFMENFLLGIFMNTFLLGIFLLWHLYWTYYQYYF